MKRVRQVAPHASGHVRIVTRRTVAYTRVHTCVSHVGTWARASYPSPLRFVSPLCGIVKYFTGGGAYVRGKEILRPLSHSSGDVTLLRPESADTQFIPGQFCLAKAIQKRQIVRMCAIR